jgi:hypothetical protein
MFSDFWEFLPFHNLTLDAEKMPIQLLLQPLRYETMPFGQLGAVHRHKHLQGGQTLPSEQIQMRLTVCKEFLYEAIWTLLLT